MKSYIITVASPRWDINKVTYTEEELPKLANNIKRLLNGKYLSVSFGEKKLSEGEIIRFLQKYVRPCAL
jgi:hypothetical protein